MASEDIRIRKEWVDNLRVYDIHTRLKAYEAIFLYAFEGRLSEEDEINSMIGYIRYCIDEDKHKGKVRDLKSKPLPYEEKNELIVMLSPEDIAEDFIKRNSITLDCFCKNESITVAEFRRMSIEVFVEWTLKGWQPSWIEKGKGEYQLNHLINAIRLKRRIEKNERQRTDIKAKISSGRSQGTGATLEGVAREILRGGKGRDG